MTMTATDMRCWRCDTELAVDRVGLCEKCRVEMQGDSTIPPGDTLLPHGTLPEEVDDRLPAMRTWGF